MTVRPMFGRVILVRELLDEEPGAEVLTLEMLSPGVIVSCPYEATAEPAGLIPIEPRSPPRAVIALPRAIDLAVPK